MPVVMEVELNHIKNLQFDANSISNPDYKVLLDLSKNVGGEDEGVRPTELLLMSFAGCSSMDIISILKKKKQDIRFFNIKVRGERADSHPKVFTKIDIIYSFKGSNINENAVKRAIELAKDTYCSVWAMLKKACDIEWSYTIENL